MFRNFLFINIILILTVSFLGLKFYKVTVNKKESPVSITVKKAEPKEIMAVGEDKIPDKASLKVITEKDIFRPVRKSSLLGANNRPLKDPPTLFGTVIIGSEKTALLKEDAGKTAKMYRVNESVSGYLIVDIHNDKVLLEAGGQTIEVKLRSKKSANSQLTSPAQRPQAGTPAQGSQGRSIRRSRVRPPVQRPVRTRTNVETPAPTLAPPPPSVPSPAPVPVPDSEPVPAPEPLEPLEGLEESTDAIQPQ